MAANESTRERIEKMSIILDHVNYVYGADTPLAVHALNDVCLKIPDGQFIGIIGHTGSGKSTLMQHMNGLIRATDGHIYFNGEDIYDKDYDMKKLRSKVGLVFQYPEHQLFEIDVFSDVCFGPKNLGLDKKEVELRAYDALKKVGLLDPKGRDEILKQIKKLQTETGLTILLVSHSMEDVAEYVDRIIVMNKGGVMYDDTPREVFKHYKELEEVGLAAPQVTYIMHDLKARGADVDVDATTIEEAAEEIARVWKAKHS